MTKSSYKTSLRTTLINELSGIKPSKVERNIKELSDLINKHPLISEIELLEAFDFANLKELENFLEKYNNPLSYKNKFYHI